jgi:hypothetical protein
VKEGREHALDAGVHLDIGAHYFSELEELVFKLLRPFSLLSYQRFGRAGDGRFGVDFGARFGSFW